MAEVASSCQRSSYYRYSQSYSHNGQILPARIGAGHILTARGSMPPTLSPNTLASTLNHAAAVAS